MTDLYVFIVVLNLMSKVNFVFLDFTFTNIFEIYI